MSFDISQSKSNDVYTGGGQRKLEAGDYPVMISKAVEQASKKGGGQNAVMEYTVLDGEFTGEVIKEWLPVVNANDVAQGIARSKVNAISTITNINSGGIDAFVGAELIIRVNKEPNEYIDRNGEKRKGFNNNIVNYMTMDMKNAEGKDVAPFVPSASQSTTTASTNSDVESGAQTSGGVSAGSAPDDEIPF